MKIRCVAFVFNLRKEPWNVRISIYVTVSESYEDIVLLDRAKWIYLTQISFFNLLGCNFKADEDDDEFIVCDIIDIYYNL
jgi:hypothetical protein